MAYILLGLFLAGGAACFCCDCECCEPNDEWNIMQEAMAGEHGAGWLNKRAKSKPIWSKRFFVLTDSKLVYYTEVDRQTCRGEIVLAGCSASISSTRKSTKKCKYFVISHPECGEREFYAKTSNRRNQWINTINDMSAKLTATSCYGKLFKQGGIAKSTWQERWAICAGSTLDYFDSPTDNQSKGCIFLQGCSVKEVTLKDQKYAFELQANDKNNKKANKKYVFCVETDGQRKNWMMALNKASDPNNLPRFESGEAGMVAGSNPIHIQPSGAGRSGVNNKDEDDDARDVSMVSVSTSPDEKSGYLSKKSPRALQGYQKRYFVLKGGKLFYFGSEDDVVRGVESKGVIDMRDVDPKSGVQHDGKSDFVVSEGSGKSARPYPLRAGSADEAGEWVAAIKQWSSFVH